MTLEKKIHKPRGGKKAGAGRKLKYKEKTTTTSFRIPKTRVEEIRALVKNRLKEISEEVKFNLTGGTNNHI